VVDEKGGVAGEIVGEEAAPAWGRTEGERKGEDRGGDVGCERKGDVLTPKVFDRKLGLARQPQYFRHRIFVSRAKANNFWKAPKVSPKDPARANPDNFWKAPAHARLCNLPWVRYMDSTAPWGHKFLEVPLPQRGISENHFFSFPLATLFLYSKIFMESKLRVRDILLRYQTPLMQKLTIFSYSEPKVNSRPFAFQRESLL
jgi:hypothetical protein